MKETYRRNKLQLNRVKIAAVMVCVSAFFFTAGYLAGKNLSGSKENTEDPGQFFSADEEGSTEHSDSVKTPDFPEADSSKGTAPDGPARSLQLIQEKIYPESEKILNNPYIGLGAWAEEKDGDLLQEISLVYVDVMWSELEPERGSFDYDTLEKRCQFDKWISEGKHAVFRFVMDEPRAEAHMDIPVWLYEMTGDGKFYDTEYGKGYCPDYNNEVLISEHERVIRELGSHYADSDFIEFVQLGSVGHWGEWHIHEDAGKMPLMAVCSRYYTPYLEAFPDDQLMLRRPFAFAKDDDPGLYNDSAGIVRRTEEWLDWIAYGGEYQDTKEQNALAPMPDAWRNAAIGGEISSFLTDEDNMIKLLTDDLQQTLRLFTRSHASWIAPGSFAKLDTSGNPDTQNGLEKLLKSIGYRFYVSAVSEYAEKDTGEKLLRICLRNTGCAPFYKHWKIRLRKTDENGTETITEVKEDIRLLMPEEPLIFETGWDSEAKKLEIMISSFDEQERIHFANDLPEQNGWMTVWEN